MQETVAAGAERRKTWEFETVVLEVVQRTPQVKSFRFQRPDNVAYLSGQFFLVTIKVKDKDAVHHFSFSSSPTEKGYIEFTKRITSSDFSQALDAMKPGAWARLKGPSGTFILPGERRKLAFLSGGIGITPFRSMLRYMADTGQWRDTVLLYGNNSVADIAFRDELDALAGAGEGLRVVHVLSGQDVPPDWKGKTGRIDRDMIAKTVPDFMERLFYASGPPKMVTSLEEQMLALDVPGQQIKKDSFTGYD